MSKIYTRIIVFICLYFCGFVLKAQVTVTGNANTTPALAATYTSLANAITALNTITAISGHVTIALNAGNPQTAPVGGYTINFTATTIASRTVTITGNNNIITTNSALVSGVLTDAVFKIIGSNFVTIQNFTMQENPLNVTSAVATNDMTEWGVALLCASTTNGAQNNTIQNNSISLNRTYSNTFGIYSNARHSATVVTVTTDASNANGANSDNNIYGNTINDVNMGIAFIGSGNAAAMDLGNDIGGTAISTANTISGWGGTAAISSFVGNPGVCYGVLSNNQKNENISFNTVLTALAGTAVNLIGIYKTYNTLPTGTFSSSVNHNQVSIDQNFASGILNGILSEGITNAVSGATIHINNNLIEGLIAGLAGTSTQIVGISNTSSCGILNINDNIIRDNFSVSATGGFTGINNSGIINFTANINNNKIGDALGNAINLSAAAISGSVRGINNTTAGGTTATLSVSGNNFQGFVQTIAAATEYVLIECLRQGTIAPSTTNINGNSFTNLVINTSGNVTFIRRTGPMTLNAGITDNCNDNRIVTAFSKPVAGGTVTLYDCVSASVGGIMNSMNQLRNNFSNITLTGATIMAGWNNVSGVIAGGPKKLINDNVFNNWTCGSGAVNVIESDLGGNNTTVNDNIISGITASGSITGILLGNGNAELIQTCSGNTISGLTSTAGIVLGISGGSANVAMFDISSNSISALSSGGSGTSIGIAIQNASTVKCYKNKLYDISGSNAGSFVYGIRTSTGSNSTVNIYNNLIGDLRATVATNDEAVTGIRSTASNTNCFLNIYYNTVYLNATSPGTNFGSSGIRVISSAVATTTSLDLRNNIIINTSTSNGTGKTTAFRRNGTTLGNFANTSNNNIFYAGIPSVRNLIFFDGTNSDQTLATYQTRVAPRDAASFTEMPPFISIIGSSPDFLHLDPASATQAENGAVNIATYIDDFDGVIRQGNAGYGGLGTAPDIGADEMNGSVVVVTNFNLTTPALAPTYTSLANAITALNTVTSMLNGTVTITLMPGNSQTAPVGGYNISTNAATALTRNIVITGSNNTITTNSYLVSGSLTDAVFKITGSNFITISNFVMRENPLNITTDASTNDMTEWGVALLKASATNGAQSNTILNNTISLNKNYSNSFGIYSNTRHTATVVGTIADASSTNGANSNNDVYGNTISNVNVGITFIGSGNAAFMDLGNDIGGASAATANSLSNMGGLAAASSFVSNGEGWYAIFMNHQKGESVSFNNIVSGALTGLTAVNARGIYKAYTATTPTGTFTSSINNNSVTLEHAFFQTSILIGIYNEGIVALSSNASININNNTLLNFSVFTGGTDIVGISNSSAPIALNINNNIFRGNFSGASTGGFTGILNTGTILSTLNINNNKLGDASGNAFTFSGATSGAINGISCPVTGDDLLLSISGNNFQGFVQNTVGSGDHNYISYDHAPTFATTVNINSNSFTNLTANTDGNVTFISRSGVMALNAGVTENCSNNSIVTGFSKTSSSGLLTFYQANSASLSGNTMVQTGNNFSNVTFPNGNAIIGWNNSEGDPATFSGPTKTISTNNFSNWNLGFADVTVLQIKNGASPSTVSGNNISGISSNSATNMTGIYLGPTVQPGLLNCSANSISNITSNGTTTVIGIKCESFSNTRSISSNTIFGLSVTNSSGKSKAISIIQGSTVTISRNKIYDLNATEVTGIDITPGFLGNVSIHNNTIGNILEINSYYDNALRGISIESIEASAVFDIFYNTIYLDNSGSIYGAGSSGVYLIGNRPGPVSLRNNIIVNASTPGCCGFVTALRGSNQNLGNYAASSNNNIFYTGIPSDTKLIYYDDFNSDQLISAFKTRVGPTAETNSFTGMPAFLSLVGSSPNFLHLNPAIASLAESRAVNIATYTTDIDVNIRQGNAGYVGTGTAPDIGADEIAGIFHETNAPVITFTDIPSPACIASPKIITGVTITDAAGIPLTGALRPRIYYRRNTDPWFSQPGTNTAGTATNSTWTFTIVEADMGALLLGDIISYFIVAQDLMPVSNIGTNPVAGTDAITVNDIRIPPATPKTYLISASLGGLYTVGSGGNFPTLTAAVNAYNIACSLTSAVIFELIPAGVIPETYPIIIRNHADASAVNTLTIRPSATTSSGYSSINDTELFKLDGARYVTFDGRQGGVGTSKSISVTNAGNLGAAFRFINDAQHNTIKYCDIRSQSKSVTGGTIVFSTTSVSGGTGNDHNTIDNNQIKDPSVGQEPINAIFSLGTASAGNDSIVITNNNIFNYYNATNSTAGIFASSNNNAWTIIGNRLFQESPLGSRLYTAAASHYAIRITSGAGYTINNNIIGFDNASGSGITKMIGNSVTLAGFPTGYSVAGISVAITYTGISCSFDPAGTVSAIDGNTIGGIAMYTSSGITTQEGMLCGISVLSGNANIGTIAGNTIGATTGSNSIYAATATSGGTVVGIYTNSTGTVAIQNNNIGGITASGTTNTKAAGITAINTTGTANYTISNNIIGNADAGNLRIGLTTTAGLLSSTGTLVSTTGTGVAFKGIECSSTGNIRTVTSNTFRGWSSSSTKASIKAVISKSTMTGTSPALTINNNFFGTTATGWGNSVTPSDSAIAGVFISYGNETVVNVKNNDFTGLGFNPSQFGLYAIYLEDTAVANNITSITGNTFTNLAVNTGYLSLITAQGFMGSNAIRNIDSNKTVGTFSFIGGGFEMINTTGFNVLDFLTTINNNEFSNAILNIAEGNYAYASVISDGNSTNKNQIRNNIVNNVNQTGGIFIAILEQGGFVSTSDTSRISNNIISNIHVNGLWNFGVLLASFSSCLISDNKISNLSLSRASDTSDTFVSGVCLYYNEGNPVLKGNEINSLSSTIDSAIVSGILVYNLSYLSYNYKFNGNKIYDLSVTKPDARVAGIYSYLYEPLGPFYGRRISVYNNIIGDLRAPASGNNSRPSIAGIYLENNTIKDSLDVYHNTIDLRASSSNPAFSSAAVYTDTLARIDSYGNIFNNISTPGATGKTVAYWRRGVNLTNFTANYNSLYAGTPATNTLIYFNGTNSEQTLTAYKTRVGSNEPSSVSELPVFVSLTGTNAGFLHLDPNTNCGLLGKAFNIYEIDEVHFDFDKDSRPNWYYYHIGVDIGADETAKFNTWTGANSTSWNDPLNWSMGTVPNGIDRNVTIPAAPLNQPIIAVGESFQARDIYIYSGATLINRGTLKIAGRLSATVGGINNVNAGIVVGSIEMNGLCSNAQFISGNMFVGNHVNNLSIVSEVTISPTAGQGINLWGTLNFGAGPDTLKTNGNLTLKSTVASTASVAEILTGNFINGDVTVERYIHTGTTGGAHTKTWQFLATPTTGQTIRQAWQENGTAPAGFGTIITGTGTGFDITTALPSIKFFNDVAVNWTAVTNTNNALLNKLGYMLFVRGDRTVTTSGANPNNTVLRSKGTLFQPSNPPASVAVAANKFQTFGNPYASRIEFSKVRAISTGINDVFYVWDPKLAGSYNVGGYQTITGVAGYVPTVGTPPTGNPATVYYPAGVPAPFIESGQAVFVKGNGTGGNVNFNETVKASGSRLVNRPGNNNNELANRGFIFASLFTNTGNIADGNIVAFEAGLGNELNELDALKIMNGGENFGIRRSDSLLAVEARDQVMKNDTIFYHLQNLKKLPYQFRFAPVNMRREGINAYLIDRFNNSSTDVSMTDSSFINFTITEDIRSQASDRFILVFKKAKQGPVKSTTPKESQEQARGQNKDITQTKPDKSTIAVYPNPVVDQQINIRFSNMAKGNYRIELSNKQGQVVYTGSKYIDQQNTTHTIKTNSVLASGSYQLSVVAEDGERMVESVVVK